MTAAVYQLPGQAPQRQPPGLNLSEEEVQDAAGGYVYAARQLRELHARGFVLATIGKNGRVVLPRTHYEAVTRGEFRQEVKKPPERETPRPNRAGLVQLFRQGRKK